MGGLPPRPIHRCQAVYNRQAEREDKDIYLFFLPPYSLASEPHRNLMTVHQVPMAEEDPLPILEPVEKSHLCHYQSLRPRI